MNIQVSNLSLNTVDADVRKLFARFGIVDSATVIRNKFNGRSKGGAIVNMPLDAQGRQAIISLHQTMMDGRRISVDELRERF
jgi:RNA recognition motif-containing protein